MNISAWAIRNPIPAIVLFLVLMLLGVFAFRTLPVTRFPNIDVPLVQIQVVQPGASPAELETQVTRKIEDAVAGITGVKNILSSVSDGLSATTLEFRIEVNTDRAVNDVKDAVARVRSDLPRGIEEPVIRRLEIEGAAIVTYGVSNPAKTIEELSWFVDDVVVRKLQSARGVASADRIGGVEREIHVQLDPDRLASFGLTAADVNRQLRATNVDLAGGRSGVAQHEQAIRTLAGASSLEELAQTSIFIGQDRKIRLSDIGTVSDTAAEPRTYARLNGQPVVAFGVFRAKGASDAAVMQEVSRKIQELSAAYPDYALSIIDTTVDYTVGNYKSAMMGLIEGSLLAVVVVFLFLRDWRATLITSIALPLSVFPTFWAMSQLGFSLNLVSLLAITLATGILVDDAIVEIENIARHIKMGKSPYRAALEAADEIGLAVIAITFTIVAVFAPVSFMGGIAGQYFKQFGLTVAVAVLFSLLVARLITPLLAAYFLRPHSTDHDAQPAWLQHYTRLAQWCVHHRYKTLGLGLLIFVISIFSMRLLPQGFIPPGDEARLIVSVELPPGSTLSDTIALTDDLTRQLRQRPEVANVFVNGGQLIGNGGKDVRKAAVIINLVHKSQRSVSQKHLEIQIGHQLSQVPDVRFWFVQGNGQRGLSLIVSGDDDDKVADVAAQLQSEMKRVPVLANPISSAPLSRPEIQIHPKKDLAAELGVSSEALSETIRVATIGDAGANLAKFNAGDRLIPIRVQLEEGARDQLAVLENLKVMTARGVSVPLGAVADIRFGQGPSSIDRFARARKIAVEADLVGTDALGLALAQVYALPIAQNLPQGVTLRETGDAEVQGEVFSSFAAAMGAGLMMVYGVLVLLFRRFLQPVTILFSIPLSIGGVIFALLITHNAFSMPVVIGMLMLIGIVTKNAIMLVDFAIEKMAQGVDPEAAIVDAGRKRARPIVMTTIAMAAGMIPSALALGDGGEFRAPMAIAVIGGLIVSTVLSLVFVPAVFVIIERFGNRLWRLFERSVALNTAEDYSPSNSSG